MTTDFDVRRRELLQLIGAGVLLGTLGAGIAAADSGRYVVGTASPAATRAANQAATSVRRVLDFGSIGQAVSGRFPQQALERLANRPDVRYVEPVAPVYAYETAGTETLPWGVDRVDADVAHASGVTGSGGTVAIIDTGIDYNHPDLAANYVGGYDYVNNDADPMDDHGHGTHCAGIAAAVDNTEGVIGVAPAASLYGVKVLAADGSGTSDDVAAGITWAADNGMDVASLSLGSRFGSTVIHDACKYAYDGKGVLVVAAAGNDGPRGNSVGYPAAYPEVIAVSATTASDALVFYSSKGAEVELAAPGSSIYSTLLGGTYGEKSGTSMACPHVSGAGGMLAVAGYTNTEARQRLRDTAEDIGLASNEQGYGLLDVQAALGVGSGGGTGDTTAPSSPTNLTSPGHTDTTVDLAWDASSDDTGVDHYDVYVNSTKAVESADTAETVTGLSAGTAYDFHVTAVDAAGNESGPSNTVTVTTDSATGGSAPAIDSFTATSVGPNNPHVEIDVAWQVSGSPDTVTLELYEGADTTGTLVESWPGLAASGTQSYVLKFGSPKTYTARLVASNAAGVTDATRTVSA